jgi:hypothetical protein
MIFNLQPRGGNYPLFYTVNFNEGTKILSLSQVTDISGPWDIPNVILIDAALTAKPSRLELTYQTGGSITVSAEINGDTVKAFDYEIGVLQGGHIGVQTTFNTGASFKNLAVSRMIYDVAETPGVNDGFTADACDANAARTLGRAVTDGGALKMEWAMSGFEFMALGANRVWVDFDIINSGTAKIGVSVDGGDYVRRTVNGGGSVLVAWAAKGDHKVKIVKLDDPETNILIASKIQAVRDDGGMPGVCATNPPARKIEFIGNSDTLGTELKGAVCKTYATVLSGAFEADTGVVAYNNAVFSKINDNYTNGANVFEPDFIIINLGVNQSTPADFANDYRTLVNTIRNTYTNNIPLIAIVGETNGSEYGDIGALGINGLTALPYNVDSLANLTEHAELAAFLANLLKSVDISWNSSAPQEPADRSLCVGNPVLSGTTLSVPYSLLNYSGENNVNLITAVYSGNRLTRIDIRKGIAGSETSVRGGINFTQMPAGEYTAKMLIWDGSPGDVSPSDFRIVINVGGLY